MSSFTTITDFINYKNKCIFCQNNLSITLSNFSLEDLYLFPSIYTKYNNYKFEFHFSYNSIFENIDTFISIDSKSNQLMYDIIDNERRVLNILEQSARPHIELSCFNDQCKTKYTIATKPIRFENSYVYNLGRQVWNLKPLQLRSETAEIDNIYIYNDLVKSETKIFPKKPYINPIKFDFLNLSSYPKNQLIHKIKTQIIFS